MLTELYIKNIALIKELQIDFSKGLNCLSGETGSGKSIIIDALAFVLGDRADRGLIKYGEERAIVQAVFEIDEKCITNTVLNENGIYPDDGRLIISRMMSINGKNEIRINGRLTVLNVLRSITESLVDIFGQSDHLNLLNKESHLGVIDGYRKTELREKLRIKHCLYDDIRKELKQFGGDEAQRARSIDLLNYQIDEIESAELVDGEEEALSDERLRIIHCEKIRESIENALALISGDGSASEIISEILGDCKNVARFDASFTDKFERVESLMYEINDIESDLESYYESIEFDADRLEYIEKRLELIKNLKRKYGNSVTEINQYALESKVQLDKLLKATERVAELESQKHKTLEEMYSIALELSEFRRNSASDFCSEIQIGLAQLGMSNAVFSAHFNEIPTFDEYCKAVSPQGFDNVEFYMSANKGEPPKPLVKVISGGEMSRLMLAIKTITAGIEGIETLIFDEIDTGISGEMALKVALKLKALSKDIQCIVITHLPQLAALADTNYLISKQVEGDKTQTNILRLSDEEKVKEVARLCGGERSEQSLLYAKELIRDLNSRL